MGHLSDSRFAMSSLINTLNKILAFHVFLVEMLIYGKIRIKIIISFYVYNFYVVRPYNLRYKLTLVMEFA